MSRICWRTGFLGMMVTAWGVLPTGADAQAVDDGDAASVVESVGPLEWRFERLPDHAVDPSLATRERWASPFAVISRGSVGEREPRRAVLSEAEEVAEVDDPTRSVAIVRVTRAQGAEQAEEAEEAEEAPVTRPETHRVAYGETWFGLALRYGVSWSALAAANPGVNPERIREGTVLRIPAATAADSPDAPPPPRSHTVVRGDSLYGLARRYGVSVEAIRSANGLTNDTVRIGQTLVIPQEEIAR